MTRNTQQRRTHMYYLFTLINGLWWNTGKVHFFGTNPPPAPTATTKFVYWKDC